MNRATVAISAAVLLAVGAGAGYWFAHSSRVPHASSPPPSASQDRQVLYWHDPMYPQQKFDKPGKSPFMDMDLVPVYAEESAPATGV